MSIERRIKLGAAMVIGLTILLATLVGFTVKALLAATDEVTDEFENEAVVLLDLHAGMFALVTLVGASLEGNLDATPAIAPLMQSMDEKVALLEVREAAVPDDQRRRFAEATAQWLQARAMIPGVMESGVAAGDPSVLPTYTALQQASQGFRAAHESSLEKVEARHGDLHTLESTIRGMSLGIVLFIVAGAAVWMYYELRTILRPLRELEAAAQRVMHGDFTEPVPVSGPTELASLAGSFNAMLRGVRERETKLTFRALHDPLTGLGNRALLDEQLRGALSRLHRGSSSTLTLLFLDLDDFKRINDTLGHAAGDETIRDAGQRIKACLRDGDMLARLGGDEFAVVVENIDGAALALGERIRDVLRQPFTLGDSTVSLTASVGIVETSSGREAVDDLLRYADLAMYRAKSEAGDQVCFFDNSLNVEATNRFEIEGALRHGISHDELRVYYQPVFDLATGSPRGVEALVRWMHPTRGLLLPDEFLPIAEETGLIVPLGNQVLHIAMRDVSGWVARGEVEDGFTLAVNVSAREIVLSDFVEHVEHEIKASGLAADRLILEITETALLKHSDELRQRLASLRSKGIRIALDDFGTGYSSLQRLNKLPVDVVKIDRSFVIGIAHRDDLMALARAVIELASSFGYEVIAEGIEADEDSDALQGLGCNLGQGFGLARPVLADALQALLETIRIGGQQQDHLRYASIPD